MKRLALAVVVAILLPWVSGCGDGKGAVRGTVTFDGQSVKSGAVTFVSLEGPLVREGAAITDGAFTAKVPPGKYKLELNAQKFASKRKQIGMDGKEEELTLTEELFPAYYNAKSELVEMIKAGDNTITLNLKTKK